MTIWVSLWQPWHSHTNPFNDVLTSRWPIALLTGRFATTPAKSGLPKHSRRLLTWTFSHIRASAGLDRTSTPSGSFHSTINSSSMCSQRPSPELAPAAVYDTGIAKPSQTSHSVQSEHKTVYRGIQWETGLIFRGATSHISAAEAAKQPKSTTKVTK